MLIEQGHYDRILSQLLNLRNVVPHVLLELITEALGVNVLGPGQLNLMRA
jgi:hypothetical protein